MAETYTKLFSSIITSSIWGEDDKTRIVWITLLALADFDGFVSGSMNGLARVANLSVDDCNKGLMRLQEPDSYSRTPDEEGRRIKTVDGGWFIINHAKYRNKGQSRKEYYRDWRAKKGATVAQREIDVAQRNRTQTETDTDTDTLKNIFEKSRRLFGGKKNELDVEFENFLRVCCKHSLNPKETVSLLLPAIEKEKLHRERLVKAKEFCPAWTNFQTWINQRRWTQELPEPETPRPGVAYRRCPDCNRPLNSAGVCSMCEAAKLKQQGVA